MARPTLTTHRKFRRLARLLGGPALARGTLELLWDVCYQAGDAHLGDAIDVEEAACWQGEAGACVKALVACGFLDPTPDGEGFAVHDLFDHAPDYVFRRAEREQHRRAKGASISDLRRQAAQARWQKPMQMNASENHLHTGRDANDGTRAPAPAHAPARAPSAPPPPGRRWATVGGTPPTPVCGRICLPAFLFTEFVALHGGPEDVARRYVTEFFAAHDPPDDGQPIGDDPIKFWRATWAAHHQSRAPDTRTIRQAQRSHAGHAAVADFLAAKDV